MLRPLTLVALLLAPALAHVAAPAEADDLRVTYLGNEAFLLESGGRKVLVDALLSQDSHKGFVDMSLQAAGALRRAEAPYDDVDLVLTTHVHADHFDPLETGLHLTANPKAVFVSTEQVVSKLKKGFNGFAGIADRVRAVSPEESTVVVLEDLGLTVLNLHHGRERQSVIENNGYLIELGGHRLLHLGDAEVTAEELEPLALPARGIDIAFVPSWYLDAEPWIGAIETAVKPERVVVMHLAPRWHLEARTNNQSESRKRALRIREAYPEALIFEDYGSREVFPAKTE